ncbi:unnamed protein product [Gadus morhua 'NCC']
MMCALDVRLHLMLHVVDGLKPLAEALAERNQRAPQKGTFSPELLNLSLQDSRSSDAPGSDMPGSALDRCGARDSRLSMREGWRAGEQWGPDLLPDGPLNLQGISPLARQENVELLHVVW